MTKKLMIRIFIGALIAPLIAVPLATTASATTISRNAADLLTWEVQRDGNTSGVVHAPAGKDVILHGTIELSRTVAAATATDDVYRMRFEVTGGRVMNDYGSWWIERPTWQLGMASPFYGTTGKAGAMPVDHTGRQTFYYPRVEILTGPTGELQITPVLYKNNVRVTGSLSDLFIDFKPRITFPMAGDASYTVHAEDTKVSPSTAICADLTGQSTPLNVTSTQTITINGTTAATGGVRTDTEAIGPTLTGRFTGGSPGVYQVLSPSAAFMAEPRTSLKVNSADTNVVTNDVLTSTFGLTVGGTSVVTECPLWNSAQPSYLNGSIDTARPWDAGNQELWLLCQFTDVDTSQYFEYNSYVSQPTQNNGYCNTQNLIPGHNYHLVARTYWLGNFTYGADRGWDTSIGVPMSVGSLDFTATIPDVTPPTLPGSTGAGAITWASFDNPTDTTMGFFGRGNSPRGYTATSSSTRDGFDGALITSRVGLDTIRLEHLGPYGRYQLAGQNYIDFQDPVPSWDRSQRVIESGSLAWYGPNHDKWVYIEPSNNGYSMVTGTYASTATVASYFSMNELDQICYSLVDSTSYHEAYIFSAGWMAAQSASSESPLLNFGCTTATDGGMARPFNTVNVIAKVGTVSNGIATLDGISKLSPLIGQTSTASYKYLCSWGSSASNAGPNLTGSDVAYVYVEAVWDDNGNNPCYSQGNMAPDEVSVTLVHVDGSVTSVPKANYKGLAGSRYSGITVGFDSNGDIQMLWATTTSTAVMGQMIAPFTTTYVTMSDAGVMTEVKNIELDGANASDSRLFIISGVGDATTLYARRGGPTGTCYSVVNITTGKAWSGECAAVNASGVTTADNSGNMFVIAKFKENTYSVLRWGVGSDPTAVKEITSGDAFTKERGVLSVETATTNITTPTWSIDGGINQSLFTIDASTGELRFKTAQPVGTYVVVIKATNGSDTDTQTVTITVVDTTAPDFDITTPNTSEVHQHISVTPTNVTESATFTIGGADANLFDINPTTGEITYKNTPTTTGSYDITVTATDAAGNHTTKNVHFDVTPDVTPPVIETAASLTVDRGDLSLVELQANEDSTWELAGGTDESLFRITNGTLEFISEVPVGTYVVIVKATDLNGSPTTKTITITVVESGVLPPVGPKFQPQANGKTKIWWTAPNGGADHYAVKVAGSRVCTTTALTCIINRKLTHSSNVVVYSYGQNSSSAHTPATYVAAAASSWIKMSFMPHFALGSPKLTKSDMASLRKLARYIKKQGFTRVDLVGHVDNNGPTKIDGWLSGRRAKNVRLFLAWYLPKVKITVSAAGRHLPAKSNSTSVGQAFNRRVEIYVK